MVSRQQRIEWCEGGLGWQLLLEHLGQQFHLLTVQAAIGIGDVNMAAGRTVRRRPAPDSKLMPRFRVVRAKKSQKTIRSI